MKPRIALLALPLLFGFIFTLSLLLGLKQPTAAQAAALDAAGATAEGTAAEAADPPQPENIDEIFGPEAGWFANKAWMTNAVAWIDIDRDGDLDLALANQEIDADEPKYLLIYENADGGIRYTPQQTFTLPSDANSMAWGDMDNDGWLDVAVGMTDTLAVYTTMAGEVITPAAWSYTGTEVTSVGWSDFDRYRVWHASVR